MYDQCWSCYDQLLIIGYDHWSCYDQLLIMYDQRWSCYDQLLIVRYDHWSLPWKTVDRCVIAWPLRKTYESDAIYILFCLKILYFPSWWCCARVAIFTWNLRCNISCKMLWPCRQKYQTIYEWNSWDSLGAETQMEMFAFSFASSARYIQAQ